MTEATTPTNVIQALARVMEELPAIGKENKSQQGYNYRGIEQITAHAQRLFGKYGIVFVPHVQERKTVDLVVNGKPWTEEQLHVGYTVYGPGGITDKIEVGPVLGLGRDNSDKGANKAITQAYKYALLQTLCISDAKDDADSDHAHEADPEPPTVDLWNTIKAAGLSKAEKAALMENWKADYSFGPGKVPLTKQTELTTLIDSFVGTDPDEPVPALKAGEEPFA
ncbi:UNVERIFIED_CONTAM: ERF family protein [Kocuria sp. CPCC 205316]|uniref:ERF family protein n=1 Tax=Kocuria TaxID=57493 RepID=UPI0036DC62AE